MLLLAALAVLLQGKPADATPAQERRLITVREFIIRVPGRRELVSGLFARAEVKVRDVPGSLTVPPAALLRDGSDPAKAQTFVVAGNKVERRDVQVGFEVPDAVQVTGGLKAGEVVVVDPPSALGPGMQVQVERAGKAGS